MNLHLLLLTCIFKLMQSKYYVNPPVDVVGQCYYHTSTGLVNSCTDKKEVPNCQTTSVPQFSYEACDCNRSVSGVDTIVVLDQFPYSEPAIPNSRKASADSWRQSLYVLAAVLKPILGSNKNSNTLGFIRPNANGCDFFGYTSTTFLRPAELLDPSNYPWVDQGNCVPNTDSNTKNMTCDRVQVKHMDCVKIARDVLAARSRSRKKNIISIRHTNGDSSHPFVMKNEPSIDLAYFVVTTSYAPLTSDWATSALVLPKVPDFSQLCVDFTGFEKESNHFIHFTTHAPEIKLLLNMNGRGGLPQGYLYCNDSMYLQFLSNPRYRAPAQLLAKRANMICTLFPARPTLAWLPVQGVGALDQNFIRRVISAMTSWLGGKTSPAPSPTNRPTTKKTGDPCEKNEECSGNDVCCSTNRSGKTKKCQRIGIPYKNSCQCRGPDQGKDCRSKKCSRGNKCDCAVNSDCGKGRVCCKLTKKGRKGCVSLKGLKKRCQCLDEKNQKTGADCTSKLCVKGKCAVKSSDGASSAAGKGKGKNKSGSKGDRKNRGKNRGKTSRKGSS